MPVDERAGAVFSVIIQMCDEPNQFRGDNRYYNIVEGDARCMDACRRHVSGKGKENIDEVIWKPQEKYWLKIFPIWHAATLTQSIHGNDD